MNTTIFNIQENCTKVKLCYVDAQGRRKHITAYYKEKHIDNIPEGYFRYLIRSQPDNPSKPRSIEKRVFIGYMGDIISDEEMYWKLLNHSEY